jgi:cytochrome c551/c552
VPDPFNPPLTNGLEGVRQEPQAKLAAVRRLLALAVLAALLVGCSTSVPGSRTETTPTPVTVIGPVSTTPAIVGDPAAGKVAFVTNCGACHVFTPAGTKGTTGPNLDKLAEYAQQANQGTLPEFIKASIVDPNGYIAPGFKPGLMPGNYGQSLTPKQIADLVAFLSKSS